MVLKLMYHRINLKTLEKDLEYIKTKISNDEFFISSRAKNEGFKRKYRFVQKSDYKRILMDLNSDDFDKYDKEEHPDIYGNGIIYVFIKECDLMNLHGDKELVKIYIKIKIPDKGNSLPVISFQVSEYM